MLNQEGIMSLQDVALPIDVPWKLIATSNDMLATHKNVFPNAMWKSSLAVFAYDPDLSDLPETFTDRELSFLKVVCSITSYSPCVKCPPPPANRGEFNEGYQQWQLTCKAIKELEKNTYLAPGR
jgi:hypothetical protein